MSATRLPRAVRPLRHAAYRRLAGTLACSVLAEGLWVVAVVWQVIDLGGGASTFSAVSGALALGLVLTALLGGVLADRWSQRRMPRLVPAEELQAVNGLEGTLRPVLLSAVGPALAGAVVAAAGPGPALVAEAVASGGSLVCAWTLPATPVPGRSEGAAVVADLREGFRYMLLTRWLRVTIVFACLMILVMLGPLEVLVPFAVKDRARGGPGEHAVVLAVYGAGGAVGSLAAGSLRTPRRYLTAMIVMWSVASLPLAVFGLATTLAPMVAAAFVAGALFSAPQVIWGTLLQRRVPPGLLGRVSSLDFFVSLGLMPVSMALAGPVSGVVGLTPVFVVAALAPVAIGAVALVLGRLGPDELAHPLDAPRPSGTGRTDDEDPGAGRPGSSSCRRQLVGAVRS